MNFHPRHPIRQLLLTILLACILMLPQIQTTKAATNEPLPFIMLSSYRQSIPIDGQFLLIAITSDGSVPTFKSSRSSIASVNTYGSSPEKNPAPVRSLQRSSGRKPPARSLSKNRW